MIEKSQLPRVGVKTDHNDNVLEFGGGVMIVLECESIRP